MSGGDYSVFSEDKSASSSASSGGSVTMEGIEHPGINDVMFGRGGDTNYHIGNHRFRVLADEHRQGYRSSSRKEKHVVVQEVVRIWRDRGGRFLAKTNPEKGDESLWHDVGDAVAKKKAAKILSEKPSEEKNKDPPPPPAAAAAAAGGGGGNNDSRKRPAVDSVDADQAVKRPAVSRLVATGNQAASLTTATSSSAGTAASMVLAARRLTQQPPPPPAPMSQVPLQLGSMALQPPLRQMLPVAGAVASTGGGLGAGSILGSTSTVHELLGLRSNPLTLAGLSRNAADLDIARLSLAAHVIAQERSAAMAKAVAANSVVGDLRILSLIQLLLPGFGGDNNRAAGATIALLGALRLGLNNQLANFQREDNDNNPNPERRSDPPSG